MSDLLQSYVKIADRDDINRPGDFAPFSVALADAFSSLDPNGGAEIETEKALGLLYFEQYHDRARKAIKRGLERCESPIERRILPWLVCQQYQTFQQLPTVLLLGEAADLKPFTVAVVPQLPIGRRRTDFALAARREGPIRFFIVECDGAAFHADVHKDVERDAELLRNPRVLDVHPITGREIKRDPKKASADAARALTNAWLKHLGPSNRKML